MKKVEKKGRLIEFSEVEKSMFSALSVIGEVSAGGKFDWDAPTDPDLLSDNYFQGSISGALREEDGIGVASAVGMIFRKKDVQNESDGLYGIAKVAQFICGEPEKDPTRKEMLIAFMALKIGQLFCAMQQESKKVIAPKGTKVLSVNGNELPKVVRDALLRMAKEQDSDNEVEDIITKQTRTEVS